MTREVQTHQTNISIVKAAPTELYAGTDMELQVKVACPSNCNLQGSKVRIVNDESVVVKEVELVSFDGAANETAGFVVQATAKPGEFTWTAVFVAQDREGILHEESAAPFSFVVKPHTTSMAVWDVPSPIVFSAKFIFKVGVQCSAKCTLAGREIEIYDHQGTKVATGTLGDLRWSDTGALYWAEVEGQAPDTEGLYTWEAKFPKSDLGLGHEDASYTFSFRIVRQPEHVVTVKVIDQDTQTPINHAEIILHPYRAYSDERGIAKLMVPAGEFDLYVSAFDKKVFQTTVKVTSDVSVRAELVVAPPVEDTSGG